MKKSTLFLTIVLCLTVSQAFGQRLIRATDTLWIDSIVTHSGQQAVLNVSFSNSIALAGIDCPLSYDFSDFRIDSISFAGSRIEGKLTAIGFIDTAKATVHIGALDLGPPNTFVDVGTGLLAQIHLTVPDNYPTRLIPFDTTTLNTELTFVPSDTSSWYTPEFLRGFVDNAFAPALADSIWIDSVEILAGESFEMGVYALTELGVKEIHLPLSYASDNIVFDSLSAAGTRCQDAEVVDAAVDGAARTVLCTVEFADDRLMNAGTGRLFTLYFSSLPTGASTDITLDTVTIGDTGLTFALGPIYQYVTAYPAFTPGKITVNIPTDVEEPTGEPLPGLFALQQNHPNPFNPSTTIRFALPATSAVRLEVFNVLGQCVKTLVDGTLAAGEHSVVFDGRDSNGRELASGIYLYRMKAGEKSASRKMMLLK